MAGEKIDKNVFFRKTFVSPREIGKLFMKIKIGQYFDSLCDRTKCPDNIMIINKTERKLRHEVKNYRDIAIGDLLRIVADKDFELDARELALRVVYIIYLRKLFLKKRKKYDNTVKLKFIQLNCEKLKI